MIFCVGTGYTEAFGKKNFCQAAHADAADADEVNVNRMIKIYLIHRDTLPVYYLDKTICHQPFTPSTDSVRRLSSLCSF